jgi:hypothetical protein
MVIENVSGMTIFYLFSAKVNSKNLTRLSRRGNRKCGEGNAGLAFLAAGKFYSGGGVREA